MCGELYHKMATAPVLSDESLWRWFSWDKDVERALRERGCVKPGERSVRERVVEQVIRLRERFSFDPEVFRLPPFFDGVMH